MSEDEKIYKYIIRLRTEKVKKNAGFRPVSSSIQRLNLGSGGEKMYIEKTVICGTVREVEKYHTSRYNQKGIRPKKKEKPTSEQMQKVNERNAIKRLRRLMNTNFGPGDYHTVLTYTKDQRPDPEGARKNLKKFLGDLRREYRKREQVLKYIIVTEWKGKSIHHHILLNNIPGTDNLIQKHWPYGRPHNTCLDDSGNYGDLAAYFVKETQKTFREADNPNRLRYSCSRNLKKPIVKVRIIRANTWREDPKPVKGYELVKDSVKSGVSEVTGYGYQYYMLLRVDKEQAQKGKKQKNEKLQP